MVPYVDAVVAVTVMRVLLFVLHVCMLRECEVGGNVGVVVVSTGHVDGKRGSSVIHGMRGVGGVCEMFMCWIGAAWVKKGGE